VAWLTDELAGEGVPLVQPIETVTDAELLSEKILLTVRVALFSVFVIVHDPLWLTIAPEHGLLEV
jgi:hypothetical protein